MIHADTRLAAVLLRDGQPERRETPSLMDIAGWSGLKLVEEVAEGNRNEVWRADFRGETVAVRRSRRSVDSLAWELDLIERLNGRGFVVPSVRRADDGRRSIDGIVVQNWLEGREPTSTQDWQMVASELQRLHRLFPDYPQRPDCCVVTELGDRRRSVDADLDAMPIDIQRLVLEVFGAMADAPTSLIHGDPDSSNVRVMSDGRLGLLDWDESRVDISWHDLSNLEMQVLEDDQHELAIQLSDAWEAAVGWVVEPDYAARRLRSLISRQSDR